MAYNYACADLNGLCRDHLRDVSWDMGDIPKLSTSTAVGEFCEWV